MANQNGDNQGQLDHEMTDAEVRDALRHVTHQLQLLGQRNDQLQQRNLTAAVDQRDAQVRIERLEAALRGEGVPANGGGGPAVRGGGGQEDGPPPPPRGNPRMTGLHFEAKETDDWISFRQAFLNAALFNNYTLRQAKLALKGAMRGAAFLSVQDIELMDDQETLEQVLDAYEAKFMPPAASDMARSRFETAMQGAKETILQWHGRLRMLSVRAYGGGNNEAQLIRAFAKGLRVRDVRKHVLRFQPDTYDAALNLAQTEQAVIDSCSHIPGSVPEFATNIAGQQSRGNAGARGVTQDGEPMEIGAIGKGGIQCHTCHLFGHIARDCGLVKKTDVQKGGSGGAGGRRFGGAQGGAKDQGKKPPGKRFNKRFVNALADLFDHYQEEGENNDEPEAEAAEEDEEEEESGDTEESQDF